MIDCGGVGYELSVPDRTLAGMPAPGGDATVLSHLIVREDSMQLYGFGSETERGLFTQLISVAGIGPRMALAALSESPPAELRRAIASGDAKRFQAVPGIGRKTAERIIVELRDKVSDELVAGVGGAESAVTRPMPACWRGRAWSRSATSWPRPRRCSTRSAPRSRSASPKS